MKCNEIKMMKYAFKFILKALFVLNIFKILSWLFGHAEKTVIFKILDVTACL